MILTELAIDDFGACRNVRLSRLANGLNLLFGPAGTGKTTLQRYIQKVLFGFSQDHPGGRGHLVCQHHGQSLKMTRPALATGELSVDDLSATPQPTEPVRQYLRDLGPEFFEKIYYFDSKLDGVSINRILQAMQTRLGVRAEIKRWPEQAASSTWLGNSAMDRVDWNPLLAEIRKLQARRSERLSQFTSNQAIAPTPRVDLEAEIEELTRKIQPFNLQPLRDRIATIDTMIRETRGLLESALAAARLPAPSPPGLEILSVYYAHLDDLDQQIVAWREFQCDIQAQRRRRRDEVSAGDDPESRGPQHPYQQVRELFKSLQQQLNRAETASHGIMQIVPSMGGEPLVAPVLEGYESIRDGLHQLFAELERENQMHNQRAATAELRQLRKQYNEMGEHLEELMDRRQELLDRIESLDRSATEAGLHHNPAYQYCAAEEGHWAARRRFLGEIQHVPDAPRGSTTTRLRQRMTELQDERRELVLQLVDQENDLAPLETRLAHLRSQRMTIAWDYEHAWDDELSRIESRLSELEHRLTRSTVHRTSHDPASWTDPLLRRAGQLASQLTLGEVTEIIVVPSAGGQSAQLITEDRYRDQIAYDSLRSVTQQQVALSLCLASVEALHRQGLRFPMLLDDIWEEMDPARIKATFQLLDRFCRQGIQVIATTTDRRLVSLALDAGTRLHELTRAAHCSRQWVASSRPQWVAVVEPASVAPGSRHRVTSTAVMANTSMPITYPLVDYAAGRNGATKQMKTEAWDKPLSEPVESTESAVLGRTDSSGDLVLEFAPLVDESTPLINFDLFTPSNSASLKQCGIHDVADLLQQNTEQLTNELSLHGFTPEILETWQSITWLMICVPGLRIEDAHLLRSVGIAEPEQLFTTTSLQLRDRMQRVLLTRDDPPVQWRPEDYSTDRINRWYRALDRTRSRWQTSNGYSRQIHSQQETPDRPEPSPVVQQDETSSQPISLTASPSPLRNRKSRRRRASSSTNQVELSIGNSFNRRKNNQLKTGNRQPDRHKESKPLKFHLDLQDHVESAPSVNKKTAGRLQAIGIATIQDLLARSAESMAELLDGHQNSVQMIEAWQNQAELVCRIPNLRGHDAQILVACGITDPEMLNGMSADDLFSIVQPFTETKQGIKIIRSGKKPDLAEVRNWIQWSNQNRKLKAA